MPILGVSIFWKGELMETLSAPSRKSTVLSVLWTCLLSCGLTLAILAVVYALRGIWPFGTDNVAYVDTAQFYLPDYYKLWDAMHGASWDINWFVGLIEGGNAGWIDFTTPANWVFLFLPRDRILEGLSLYLAVYLLEIAVITGFVISMRFRRLSLLWKTLLTLSYTFSGFVLQYYANFFWLWIVAVFPLMLWFLELLLRDGKYLPYAILYAYYLYYSVYYTYMVTIYILLFSLGYCLFLLPKELRGDRILRLGLSTAAAYGITAYFWLGSSSSLAGSSRFQSNLDSGLMSGLTTWNIPNTRHTTLMLLGMAFVMALLIRALLYRKRLSGEPKAALVRGSRFFLFLLGALAIPMVFTNIDTAWHFGQYNFFPMRYGYVIAATLLAAAGLCLENETVSPAQLPSGPNRIAAAGGAVCAIALAVLVPMLWPYLQEYGACFLTVLGKDGYWKYFSLYIGCGLLFTGLYMALFHLKNRRLSTGLIAAALFLQIGSNAYGLLAPGDDHVYTNEYDPAYVETADALYEHFSGQEISPLERFKNVDNSLNAGYPAMAGVSSISSTASSNSNLRLGVFQELGYTINYFRILDTGGTVFSDMLFGVQHILSAEELDPTLYTDTGVSVDGIRIGKANYPGFWGLTYAEGALEDYLDILTIPDRLNALYQAFTGSAGTIASNPAAVLSVQGDSIKTYTLTFSLEEDSFLYLAADGVLMNISAGGKTVPVPSYLNTKNIIYPAAFNSNLLYLGCFEAGDVPITFLSASALTEENLTAVSLSKAKVESFYADAAYDPDTSLSADDDSISLHLTTRSGDRRLFLPITYSSRWQCVVNGETVTPERTMGILMSIPLQEGENDIVLTRGPSGVRFSRNMAISLACLVLALLWLILRRCTGVAHRLQLPGFVYSAAKALFYTACIAVLAFVYLVPTVLLITQGTIVGF